MMVKEEVNFSSLTIILHPSSFNIDPAHDIADAN
jgi:hypothetical protein